MTENEVIKYIKNMAFMCGKHEKCQYGHQCTTKCLKATKMAIQALEEIQQYRAIGTVEKVSKLKELYDKAKWLLDDERKKRRNFEAIGTIEEFKALKDKSAPKKPIEKVLPYSEEFGFNSEWKCPTCGAYVGYFSEGMSEPEQMEYCNECGQHIAKDWTET